MLTSWHQQSPVIAAINLWVRLEGNFYQDDFTSLQKSIENQATQQLTWIADC
jgi:hypothetical protein